MNSLVITFLGIGKISIAPGTFGSLGALLIWYVVPENVIVRIIILSFTFLIGLICCKKELDGITEKDPSYIVIDEAIGMWITLLIIPQNIFLFVLGFFIFRFFDILKPSFIYTSQSVSGVWGVFLDDILSGILALFFLIGISY